MMVDCSRLDNIWYLFKCFFRLYFLHSLSLKYSYKHNKHEIHAKQLNCLPGGSFGYWNSEAIIYVYLYVMGTRKTELKFMFEVSLFLFVYIWRQKINGQWTNSNKKNNLNY